MKIYQEKYFNSTYWILENIKRLKINSDETVVLLMIDYFNHFNEPITVENLASNTNISKEQIDLIIKGLMMKGYLKINNVDFKISFDITPLFESNNDKVSDNDIFELIEQHLGRTLSQKEAITISEWTRIYDNQTILDALREAVINNKKSINYIEKVLSNEKEQ